MAILESPVRPALSRVEPIYDAMLLPNRVKWTRAEFAQLEDRGERYELIYGELVKKMSMNGPHAVVVDLLGGALKQVFMIGFAVRMQLPMAVSESSEPEPDGLVVEGKSRDFLADHPATAALAVEVSDSTLATDLGVKVALYAQAGVAEYWVIDINARTLHVYRTPIRSAALPNGYGYQNISLLSDTDSVSPLAAPQSSILIADLLP